MKVPNFGTFWDFGQNGMSVIITIEVAINIFYLTYSKDPFLTGGHIEPSPWSNSKFKKKKKTS